MHRNSEPDELGPLEIAVNHAASRANVLWLSFVTFATYLLVTVGSVSHRQLFLQSGLKLPGLGVELSLTGFFFAAPIFFLVFHFYTFLELQSLSEKIQAYETELKTLPVESLRRRRRYRLDNFVFVKLQSSRTAFSFAGTRVLYWWVAWFSMVGLPIVLLILTQVKFLPYHDEGITWAQRIVTFADVLLIFRFWPTVVRAPAEWQKSNQKWDQKWIANFRVEHTMLASLAQLFFGSLKLVAVMLVWIFSFLIITFPGELTYVDPWRRLTFLLFEGNVDLATGKPRTIFGMANRLVMPDADLGVGSGEINRSLSLRGRDLRDGIFDRLQLRGVDFSGANLRGASLKGADLRGAKFFCSSQSAVRRRSTNRTKDRLKCTLMAGAWLDDALLQGASLDGAQLHGASLVGAHLEVASLNDAELPGANLFEAKLQGASLRDSHLEGSVLDLAELDGADLSNASLFGVSFLRADLRGALLGGSDLRGAEFGETKVFRAVAWYPGTLQPAFLGNIDALTPPGGNANAASVEYNMPQYAKFLKRITTALPSKELQALAETRLQRLSPDFQSAEQDRRDAQIWAAQGGFDISYDVIDDLLIEKMSWLICHSPFGVDIFQGLKYRASHILVVPSSRQRMFPLEEVYADVKEMKRCKQANEFDSLLDWYVSTQ